MSFKIEVDRELCTGYGMCIEVCPFYCFGEPVDDKAVRLEESQEDCMGCIACEA